MIPSVKYEPLFDVYNSDFSGLGDSKIGSKVSLIVNYEVREKTKNYVILQIKGTSLIKSKRIF